MVIMFQLLLIRHILLLALFPIFLLISLYSCKPKQRTFKPIIDEPYKVEKSGSYDPISSGNRGQVKKGGTYTTWSGPFPRSLNYWLDTWHTSGEIMGLLFESLISLHSTRNVAQGELAQSWTKSPDNKTFTFKIHPEAKWSDGQAVKAEDVQFYYDTIMNPKHLTTPFRVILGRFERPEVLNQNTIRIKSKKIYWKAFWDAGFFMAFPKHIWKNKNFNKINFKFPVVNGPYELREVKRHRYALLRRRANWWGRRLRYNQNKYNFDYIRYRFMEDRTAALEAFKKGEFDVYSVYTSSLWVQQTKGDVLKSVENNWVIRQEIYNKKPKGFQGFAINLRRDRFNDVRVRKALCHLLDRASMNENLMFNQYFLLNSYFPDLYPNNINPKVPLCDYNPSVANVLLDQAGWRVGEDGIRKKDGRSFKLVFSTSASDLRHINLYAEALKNSGIDARIEQLSHATLTEKIDNFQFDLYWVSRGGSRLRDPEALFHSDYANKVATANISGLKDKKVDGFIEQLKFEKNINRRTKILRALDLRLTELRPYVLLWQTDKTRLLYWNRFGTPKYILDKYNSEDSIISYWYLDSAKVNSLKDARNRKEKALPPHRAGNKVYYRGQ